MDGIPHCGCALDATTFGTSIAARYVAVHIAIWWPVWLRPPRHYRLQRRCVAERQLMFMGMLRLERPIRLSFAQSPIPLENVGSNHPNSPNAMPTIYSGVRNIPLDCAMEPGSI